MHHHFRSISMMGLLRRYPIPGGCTIDTLECSFQKPQPDAITIIRPETIVRWTCGL
jgi:hypothetical protein